jgi:beta-glucosidase
MRYSSAVAASFALLPNLVVSQGYTNESEVPLYGLSPPVYPSRKCFDRVEGSTN